MAICYPVIVHPLDVTINLSAAVNPGAPGVPVMSTVFDVTVPWAAMSLNISTKAAVDILVYDTFIWGEAPVHWPVFVARNLTAWTLLGAAETPPALNMLNLQDNDIVDVNW